MEIGILEVISIVSFIYSLLILFFPFASINEIFIIFIWSIMVSIATAYGYKRSKLYQIMALLLLVPLIFYNSIMSIYFVVISAFLIYAYITKSFMKGCLSEYIDKLKKTYILYGVVGVLLLVIAQGYYDFINPSIPFIIIYLMTTTMMIRSIRHLEAGMDIKKIRQVNYKYLGAISVISLIVSLDKLRNSIFYMIKQTYLFLIDIVMKILYYPIMIIMIGVNKVIIFIQNMIRNSSNEHKQLIEKFTDELPVEKNVQTVISSPTSHRLIEILLIILTIYLIYKLILKSGNRTYKGSEYTEEREYIKDPKERKKRFFREKYPKELKEQIRYFYRRYLEKLDNKKVQILKSDTSLEVNEKADKVFKEGIEKIRDIYIDSRYGDKDLDKNKVEEMKGLYKNL